MVRRNKSRSSQSSSIHPPPQPIEGPSETQSQPSPTKIRRIGSSSNEERLQHGPPEVSSGDWAWLVQYWGSLEVQTRSKTDGSIPSWADLFIRTHSQKDGTSVGEKSAEIIGADG
ncbi:hypothetical protein MRB53_013783 [Persea americana]|uniref:Uncharacterized protein n=1 Tax=Persea americana TaxID=3435 RepID=A0ACC2K9H0_PERAE|nr:hypothetical protein MRB53_013783 [Persea americana]